MNFFRLFQEGRNQHWSTLAIYYYSFLPEFKFGKWMGMLQGKKKNVYCFQNKRDSVGHCDGYLSNKSHGQNVLEDLAYDITFELCDILVAGIHNE